MSFTISGIDPAPFRRFYAMSDEERAAAGVIRVIADARPGFPCRVTLEDAAPGEALLLLNHEHLPVDTPYRSSHAIFVRDGAETPAHFADVVPDQLAIRLLSVRAFDDHGMMTDAEVVEGRDLPALIDRFFADPAVAYLHAHNARRGCFAARIDRC
ncbi:MAG: hypothetical protein B7Y45_14450 [Sphingomonas sp. 28-66-16]|nr:MAG: hypothetical protein B7Y45_14450 [Sphingomonas sp. 28-66-16]